MRQVEFPNRPRAQYALSVLAVGVAFALREALTGAFGVGEPYVTFYPAVVLTAALGGFGPGLLATFLSALVTALWILPPRWHLLQMTEPDAIGLLAFSTIGVCMSFLAGLYHRARERSAALRTELALRDSAEQFRAFFENTAVGAAQLDTSGRFRLVNERMCQITGFSREELLRMTPPELCPPDEVAQEREHFGRFLRGELAVYERDTHYLRKDGRIIWVHVTSSAIRGAQGAPVQIAGIIEDITERKRAQEALQKRESTLAQAGQMAHLGAWDIEFHDLEDFSSNPLSWSAEVFRIFGYEPSSVQVTYDLFLERLLPDDRGEVARATFESLGTGKPFSIRHRVVRPDGTVRLVQDHAEVLFDKQGRPVRMVGAVQDITDNDWAEQVVRDSEEHYRMLFETMLQGVVYQDARGTITSMNPAAQRILGKTAKELVGQTAIAAERETIRQDGTPFPPTEHPAMLALRTGASIRDVVMGIFNPRENGYRWIKVSAVPVFRRGPAESKPYQVYTLFDDITERRVVDAERESLLAALRDADRRKNEFLAILSHELRNPLAPIRNSVYVLERVPPGGDQATRALAVIDRQAQHLARLVDDLLDVTRISRGKIRLQLERIELGSLIRRTADDHRDLFARNGIELQVSADGPLHVSGDPTRLSQVVGNLLENSAKFTPRGGHTRISAAVTADGRAEIRVRDDGTGIERDTLGRLFEPFVQAEKTLDRSRGGLGLGLALVKGMIQMHGGTVTAESEGLGMGSEFIVRLPLESSSRPRLSAVPAPSHTADTRRVLVIEDNTDAAESLREALELGHHVVEVAYAGPEGIEKARAFSPDVVLCDIGLPGLDGYGVARAFRADPRLGSTYMVALSGYALQEDVERAKQAGFDRHMAKPPDLAALEALLAERPAAAAPAEAAI